MKFMWKDKNCKIKPVKPDESSGNELKYLIAVGEDSAEFYAST